MSDALTTAAQQAVIAINGLNQALSNTLPVVQSVATTATAGSATLPGAPAGFLNITLPNGHAAKVPYYNT